jgi:hypothetical protein
MRIIGGVLIALLLNSNISYGQDTITKSLFWNKILAVDSAHHQIIIDAEYGFGLTYGLNYLYHPTQRLAIGTRVGINTFVSQESLYFNKRIVNFDPELVGSLRLYKSIRFELALGIHNNYMPSDKEWLGLSYVAKAGASVTLFKYFFIRSGYSLRHNTQYQDNLFRFYIGCGASFTI